MQRLAFINQASGLLFLSAKMAAKRAFAQSGTLGEQDEAITAIILCVVVAETSINEIGDWYEFHHLRPPFSISHGLPYGFDRMELRVKWSLLPMIVRQTTFDTSAEPWQSFNSLVELRNYIVHLRDRSFPRSVTALLTAKKLIKKDDGFLGFEVAQWACETMTEMFEMLTNLVAPPAEWIPVLWHWTPTYFPHGLSTPGDPFNNKKTIP